jgi:hypothetical protein
MTKNRQMILALLLVVAVVGVYFFVLFNSPRKDTSALKNQEDLGINVDQLFHQMLDKSFSLQSVTQTQSVTLKSASGSAGLVNSIDEQSVFHYQFASTGAVNFDLHLIDSSGDQFKVAGDYIVQDGQGTARIDSLSGQMTAKLFQINPNFPNYVGKWFPLISANTTDLVASPQHVADLRVITSQQVGQFVFGNFSAGQKADLEQLIINNQVYKYSAAEVHSQVDKGKKYIVYPVKVDNIGVVKLNLVIAEMEHREVSSQDEQSLYDFKADKVELYVDPVAQRLVKIVEVIAGNNVGMSTTAYSDFDQTQVDRKSVV